MALVGDAMALGGSPDPVLGWLFATCLPSACDASARAMTEVLGSAIAAALLRANN